MSRPYISIGRGGPRVGVVLGRRDVIGTGKFFVGLAAIIATMALLAHAGNLDPAVQWLIAIGAALIMFRLARRPHVPTPTAEEQQAAFEQAKAEFEATRSRFGRRSFD
jgi:hypothetical protein